MKKYIYALLAGAALIPSAAHAQRNLVVTDLEGNSKSFPVSEIQGVIFEDAPSYDAAPYIYYTRYVESKGIGNYTVEIATGEADENYMPSRLGDIMVSLEFTGPTTENLSAPELPAGYYLPGNGKEPFTFDVYKSVVYMRMEEGVEGVSPTMILDGTVDVRRDGNQYDIRMELTTMGGPVMLQYKGQVPFDRGISDYEPFEENVDLTFMGAQGRFYGNWYYPFAADMTAQFFTGTIVNGTMTSGYVLDIDFCEPKPEDFFVQNPLIADGTYTVETREDIYQSTYLPYTFLPGKMIDFMGTEYVTRTRLQYFDGEGHRKLAYINGGTFTVSENGSNFVFDFTTDDGITVTGTYSGIPYVENYCDNDVKEPKRPYSTLTEDIDLEWAPGTVAMTFNDGHSILQDAYTLLLIVTTPGMDHGDYIMLEMLSAYPTLEDGVYTVGKTLTPGEILPGTIDYGGAPIFSWYGDMDAIDDEGYNEIMGPVAGGTITVTTDGAVRTVKFNLTDDQGYEIKGEYSGDIYDYVDDEPTPYRKARKKAERSFRAPARPIR